MLGRMSTYVYDLAEKALSESYGDIAGDAGHAHSADFAVGAAARIRAEQSDANKLWGDSEGGYRLAVSGASPLGTQRLDSGGMAGFGSRAEAARVSVDEEWKEAVGLGAVAVGEDNNGDCWNHESGERGELNMRFPFWRRRRNEELLEEM